MSDVRNGSFRHDDNPFPGFNILLNGRPLDTFNPLESFDQKLILGGLNVLGKGHPSEDANREDEDGGGIKACVSWNSPNLPSMSRAIHLFSHLSDSTWDLLLLLLRLRHLLDDAFVLNGNVPGISKQLTCLDQSCVTITFLSM